MTHDELIVKAREYLEPFERMDECRVLVAEFPDVRVRETVLVCFSRSDRDDKMEVCLDRETGEPLGATYTPPKSQRKPSGSVG
jgi:hypothetical protein